MALLNATLKSLLKSSSGPFAWVLEIDGPGGQLRYSDHHYSSASEGHYEGRVTSWGQITRETSDRDGQVPTSEVTVTIADTDRAWAQLAEGSSGGSLKGSAFQIRLAHPEVAEANWATRFVGLVDSWGYPSPGLVSIRAKTNDIDLLRAIPRSGWKVTSPVWPNAPAASLNLYAPLLYGNWDSNESTLAGSVSCIYVDTTTPYRYLVCAGRAKAVNRVYVDGVVDGGWSTSYVTAGGRVWTLIHDAVDHAAAVITADVEGYEDVGDGTGTLIEQPLSVAAHYLSNWVFADYKTGNWNTTSTRIDSTTLASVAAYLSPRGYGVTAHRIDDATDPYSELRELLRTCEIKAYWTPSGKLAFGVEEPTIADPYPGDVEVFDADGFSQVPDTQELISAVTVNYLQNDAEGRKLLSIQCADQRVSVPYEETIDQEWGPAA